MTAPRIVFVPGLNPKPRPELYRPQLARVLTRGFGTSRPKAAAWLASHPDAFRLVAWTYLFYGAYGDITLDMPGIERLLHGLGRAGPVFHALSGLDIALWDIRGKLEGVSVSKLLGGVKRNRVETYASLLQYNGVVEHVKRNTERALKLGYKHIKLHERTAEAVAAGSLVSRMVGIGYRGMKPE